MAGAKNVIDMRPGKGFTTSQSNEHLRVFSEVFITLGSGKALSR